MGIATISGLFVYPIKSCGVLDVSSTQLAEFGLLHDREWVIVTRELTVLTQRDRKSMTLIQPHIDAAGTLSLTAPEMTPLAVPTISHPDRLRNIDVWGNDCAGFDQGDEVAQWLSEFLKVHSRLLRNDKATIRHSRAYNRELPSRVAFADCLPFLIISEESLRDLNERLAEPVEMSRFRPSIVIKGVEPYFEDEVEKLQLGSVSLNRTKPCARCVVVTIDQATGESKGPEPLRTLSEYRRDGEKVMFGHYFAGTGIECGWLNVGDEVRAV